MTSLRLVFTIAAFWLLTVLPRSAQAQSRIEIVRQSVSYLFGHHIAFEADIITKEQIKKVEILFREEGADELIIVEAQLEGNQTALAVYDIVQGRPIKAFTQVSYWFRVTWKNAIILKSDQFEFTYSDNRFEWLKLEDSPLRISTHVDDAVFAQEILDAAHIGLENSTALLNLTEVEDIDIYVYTSSEDLLYALNLSGQIWIAGHADHVIGVALVSIQPGPEQHLEIDRQIPHEVAHLLLYQASGDGYTNLPIWLNEGFASYNERTPDPDYLRSVQQAAASGSLIPFSDLCNSFPTNAAEAGLAYAQASSFVDYLYKEFGAAAIQNLIADYASGLSCENGTTAALGSSLNQLDRAWKETLLPENSASSILSDVLPWIVLLLLIVAGPFTMIILNNLRHRHERSSYE
ncbi:MAG: hypothetical protein IIC79_02160 [Chloroflexi bacterium]|nr:hypothetical protein [Chloroflexota bacterium]